jgi:biotin carboxyl carrier protein
MTARTSRDRAAGNGARRPAAAATTQAAAAAGAKTKAAATTPDGQATETRPPDPRGVRVTVLATDDLPGIRPVVIEPAPEPLEPTNATVGVGLLGGVAMAGEAPAERPEPALTIDGGQLAATLHALDTARARLVPSPGEPAHGVLLLDAETSEASPGTWRREVVIDGWRFDVEVEPAARAALRDRARRGRDEAGRSGPTEVRAIIPGVVVSVSVVAGDEVAAGQQLLVVEAMKMQNELRAPRDGSIERVATSAGATIEVGDLLLVIA